MQNGPKRTENGPKTLQKRSETVRKQFRNGPDRGWLFIKTATYKNSDTPLRQSSVKFNHQKPKKHQNQTMGEILVDRKVWANLDNGGSQKSLGVQGL